MCTDCLKKYGDHIDEKHPQISHQKFYEYENECCGCPEDCADYLDGKCDIQVQKD
jgi:hypothetical protein